LLVNKVPAVSSLSGVTIVDDNSPDGTGDLVDAPATANPERICVIHRPAKLGMGTAHVFVRLMLALQACDGTAGFRPFQREGFLAVNRSLFSLNHGRALRLLV
jgi:hypothetical protein